LIIVSKGLTKVFSFLEKRGVVIKLFWARPLKGSGLEFIPIFHRGYKSSRLQQTSSFKSDFRPQPLWAFHYNPSRWGQTAVLFINVASPVYHLIHLAGRLFAAILYKQFIP
jgi:hypothetical protein